jgi:hypothetical protein
VNTAKPSVIMVINIDKWTAELLGHGPVPITASLFDETRADLYYLFQNMHGEPLKLGRAHKIPSLAQRLAVLARDRHCTYPGCHADHDYCDLHHIMEWLRDQGFTNVELLGLFCHAHHRHIHLNNLKATRQPNGNVVITDRTTNETIAIATKKHR